MLAFSYTVFLKLTPGELFFNASFCGGGGEWGDYSGGGAIRKGSYFFNVVASLLKQRNSDRIVAN